MQTVEAFVRIHIFDFAIFSHQICCSVGEIFFIAKESIDFLPEIFYRLVTN